MKLISSVQNVPGLRECGNVISPCCGTLFCKLSQEHQHYIRETLSILVFSAVIASILCLTVSWPNMHIKFFAIVLSYYRVMSSGISPGIELCDFKLLLLCK
jgi:hypothetical protein